jgi:hypothetical protein
MMMWRIREFFLKMGHWTSIVKGKKVDYTEW